MRARLSTAFAASLLLGLLFGVSGCGPPKYVSYSSIHGDYRCRVPWGWNVITDDDAASATSTTFLGPFDPDFYLGIPSLQVRWFAYGASHPLRDGSAELYMSVDDYVGQMLGRVYGRDRSMEQDVHEIQLKDGRRAKHFIVLSGVEVPKGTRWGVDQDRATGKLYNVRRHAYVIVPMQRGFYVLAYPATRDGYPIYERQFNELVNSFVPLKDGPDGPPAAPAIPAGFASKGKP